MSVVQPGPHSTDCSWALHPNEKVPCYCDVTLSPRDSVISSLPILSLRAAPPSSRSASIRCAFRVDSISATMSLPLFNLSPLPPPKQPRSCS